MYIELFSDTFIDCQFLCAKSLTHHAFVEFIACAVKVGDRRLVKLTSHQKEAMVISDRQYDHNTFPFSGYKRSVEAKTHITLQKQQPALFSYVDNRIIFNPFGLAHFLALRCGFEKRTQSQKVRQVLRKIPKFKTASIVISDRAWNSPI